MTNLSKRLAAVENQAELEDAIKKRKAPSGWEPGVVWDGEKGTITTSTIFEPPKDWSSLLRERGLDPDLYEIVGDTIRWTSFDGWKRDNPGDEAYSTICYSYKAEIRLKSPNRPNLDEIYQSIKKSKKPSKEAPPGGTTFVIALSDWQTGNRDGGGVQKQVEEIALLPEKLAKRVKDLRKTGTQIDHIVIAGLGDLVEGTCLAGETEVITRDGIFPIEQLAKEGSATVKTEYGAWVEAEFRSFGVQDLRKITLTRGGNNTRVVYATPDHRWFRLESPSGNSKRVEATTDELKPGDLLVSNFGKHPQIMSPVGVMAGYVFGDGHRSDKSDRQRGCAVNVYRDDFNMLRFFDGHPQSDVLRKKDELSKFNQTDNSDYIKVSGLPSFMNDMPSLDESLSYLYGWAAGYFAADGSFSNGMLRLVSTSRENLERFEEVCARIGIGTNPIGIWKMSGTASGGEFMYAISLVPSTVPIEFMVHEGKRAKFAEHLSTLSPNGSYTNQKNRARNWRVKSVEDSGRREEVYCAIVPETHSFTLANDLLTGNCGHYPAQQFRIEVDRREQMKIVRRGIRDIIVALAPLAQKLTITAVGGNHGENRGLSGKAFTTTGDNDDVAIFEQLAEAFSMNKEAFPNISWRLPLERLTTSMEVNGKILAFTHGHLSKAGNNAAQAVWNWWKDQAHGRAHPGVADADILVVGHYHHFNAKEQEGRALFVCPSIVPVGEYFQDAYGVKTRAGTLTFCISEDGWSEMSIV